MQKQQYLELLEPIVAEYRQKPYAFWRRQIGGEPIVMEVTAGDGRACQVEIDALWDQSKPEGNIRVLVMIDDGRWRTFFPVSTDFVVAPDGSFVGE